MGSKVQQWKVSKKEDKDATQPPHRRGNKPLFRLADDVSHNTFGECHQPESEPSHFTQT